MSCSVGTLPRFAALVDGLEMTPDLITGLVTVALMQADIASAELYDTVIPEMPPARRGFPTAIARTIDHAEIFDPSFTRDLKTLIEMLGGQIKDRTHVYWHGDEHHVRGGYECIFREPGAVPLKNAINELDLLYDTVTASLSAARAVRETAELLRE